MQLIKNNSLVITIAICLGIQPVSTDLYLPTLPAIAGELGVTPGQAQLTFAALLMSFGIFQFLFGVLSDRYGRKPILLSGFCLYIVSSVVASLMHSIDALVVARVTQGIAMAALFVCGRSIPRDVHDPYTATQVLSKGLTGLGLIACFCQVLGGYLSSYFGWRVTFLAIAAYGVLGLIWVAYFQKETLRPENKTLISWREINKNVRKILVNKYFLIYTLMMSASYAGLYIFLANSSFLFIGEGLLEPYQYGFIMLMMPCGHVTGTVLCRYLIRRLSIEKATIFGGAFSLTSSSLLYLLTVGEPVRPFLFMSIFVLYTISHGINLSCSSSGSVVPFPKSAGQASALSGLIMLVVGSSISLFFGKIHEIDDFYTIFILGIFSSSVMVAISAYLINKYR